MEEIHKGRIELNERPAKPSQDLRPGDRLRLRQGALVRTLVVLGLSDVRGPAPVAQALYQETPESLAARQQAAEQRRQGVEPGLSLEQGRPTKRDRRRLADWQRWSASAEPE